MVVRGFGTNKQSKQALNIQWSLNGKEWNECVDPMLELPSPFDFGDKISENGRNLYEWNQINQTILEIDFDRTNWNEDESLTFWRFGISKWNQFSFVRNTLQCHRTRMKETPTFRTDNGC